MLLLKNKKKEVVCWLTMYYKNDSWDNELDEEVCIEARIDHGNGRHTLFLQCTPEYEFNEGSIPYHVVKDKNTLIKNWQKFMKDNNYFSYMMISIDGGEFRKYDKIYKK